MMSTTWSTDELKIMPTLESGYSADLKIDRPQLRVWLSRLEPGLIEVDQLVRYPFEDDPSWETTDSYYG